MYACEAGAFDDEQVRLLDALSADVSFAMDALDHEQVRLRAEQALREAHAGLETRVRERTAELKQSMDTVQAERQRFSDVLDNLPAYLVLLAPDYGVPFANRFFEERFGKSEGRRCYEYLFQRTEPCENCESFKPFQTNAPHHWYWTGPDGRNYDIYDFPFTDVDGSSLVMEVGLDITERKAAEAELERYRQHLEGLVAERAGQLLAANARLQAEVVERARIEESLRASNDELMRFNRAMVDRELRMIELKKTDKRTVGPTRSAAALSHGIRTMKPSGSSDRISARRAALRLADGVGVGPPAPSARCSGICASRPARAWKWPEMPRG